MKKIIEVKNGDKVISSGCDKCVYSHNYWDEESEIEAQACLASGDKWGHCIINKIHYEEVEE